MINKKTYIDEFGNLRENILRKRKQLNIKTPAFSKLMKARYSVVRKIIYDSKNKTYRASSLKPIADYFKVEIEDLLRFPNMPQYLPLIDFVHFDLYLKDKKFIPNKYFVDEFIDDNAIALKIKHENHPLNFSESVFIFIPDNQIIKNNISIFLDNEKNLVVGILKGVEDGKLIIENITDLSIVKISAITATVHGAAVRMIVNIVHDSK